MTVGRRLDGIPALTGEQTRRSTPCSARSRSARPDGGGGRFLLHGVTGSGKTEVYLQAVQAALAAGRGAIVLVPEIALTPQTVGRFQARFGDVVAVLHSGLGQRERHDEWLRLRTGEARVCVGPRSAVFAPLADIGLIVVDEEHDGSYKHEGDPRYDARAVALRRAEQHRAVLLAGQRHPAPGERGRRSRACACRPGSTAGRCRRSRCSTCAACTTPLHPHTRMALADVRAAGTKAIVLLNRRGWSNFLSCRGCGHVWMCPNCEVALVLHRAQGYLACHHCGHAAGRPAAARPAVAKHIEQARAASSQQPDHPLLRRPNSAMRGTCRMPENSVDAVLLLGPLYHLVEKEDRIACLREAGRVLRPGRIDLGRRDQPLCFVIGLPLKRILHGSRVCAHSGARFRGWPA